MSKRSLQRRLTAAGTSFDAIVDSVRSDLAYAYLQDSRLSVAQIAETLHFSETSALSRAVRRWYTVSPRALNHGGAALAPSMNSTCGRLGESVFLGWLTGDTVLGEQRGAEM